MVGGDLDYVNTNNQSFQAGREAGRLISTMQAAVEAAVGALVVGSALASMGPTGGGSLAAALPSGGASLVVGGIAIAGEVVTAAGGTLLAGHGGLMLAKINKDPLRDPNMFGANGAQFSNKHLWQGQEGMLHAENPAPGRRPGQIHFQEWGSNGHKWYFDPNNFTFLPDKITGTNPPNWLLSKLNDQRFCNAIDKGLQALGEK